MEPFCCHTAYKTVTKQSHCVSPRMPCQVSLSMLTNHQSHQSQVMATYSKYPSSWSAALRELFLASSEVALDNKVVILNSIYGVDPDANLQAYLGVIVEISKS